MSDMFVCVYTCSSHTHTHISVSPKADKKVGAGKANHIKEGGISRIPIDNFI